MLYILMVDKRTYKNYKEYSEDMTYESEVKYDMNDKGSLDLKKQIKDLTDRLEATTEEIEKSNDKLSEACNMYAGYREQIEKIKKNQDILNDRHQIEILEKDRDLKIKDEEIGRLMAKVNNGR